MECHTQAYSIVEQETMGSLGASQSVILAYLMSSELMKDAVSEKQTKQLE